MIADEMFVDNEPVRIGGGEPMLRPPDVDERTQRKLTIVKKVLDIERQLREITEILDKMD